jgi:hypothetical protein
LCINNAAECEGMNLGPTWYCKGGGGGKDLITVENLLEFVLQLSFMFEDENSLKLFFVCPCFDL